MCSVTKCCCCIDLKVGGIILGFLSILGYVYSFLKPVDKGAVQFPQSGELLLSVVGVVAAITWIVGIFQIDSRFMLFHLIISTVGFIKFCVITIIVLIATLDHPKEDIIFISISFGIVMAIILYILIVEYSVYKFVDNEYKNRNQTLGPRAQVIYHQQHTPVYPNAPVMYNDQPPMYPQIVDAKNIV